MLFTGKNNREYESPILIIRDELGIKMKDLCEQAGCGPSAIYDLAYGRSWPVYLNTWKIKPYVEKLSNILGVSIEELFPLFYCKRKPPQVINEDLYVSSYTLNISRDLEEQYENHDLISVLCNLLEHRDIRGKRLIYSSIRKHYKTILNSLYCQEDTLYEISKKINVSVETLRFMISLIFTTMRHRFYLLEEETDLIRNHLLPPKIPKNLKEKQKQ